MWSGKMRREDQLLLMREVNREGAAAVNGPLICPIWVIPTGPTGSPNPEMHGNECETRDKKGWTKRQHVPCVH